ncbi:Leucine-rich repeat-containing protein 58 [Lepeophtheirus salmonis]|uniref:Leucine-rich repeat-containing protein 58 n=1 Tax=Lepeophtheirus salmonis TaxID=72036 RepID=A0A7R8H7W6_LEPSM|nr:Leucine-rich repeat-containing protein 58 [Lepeophtheirus salmonis]CAF2918701.1 Leucine-rich repeat-containing protein 58 [Lepeophtheirus salmonis]
MLETSSRYDILFLSNDFQVTQRMKLHSRDTSVLGVVLKSSALHDSEASTTSSSENDDDRLNPSKLDLSYRRYHGHALDNVLHNHFEEEDASPESSKLITRLLAYNNLLEYLPQSIFKLENLMVLDNLRNLSLGGNSVRELSKDIGELVRLRFLYLGGNLITELPKEISKLRHLHALILCSNSLSFLPDGICSLSKLESLQLHSNKLTTLPIGLIKLKGLKELSLRDNPLINRFVNEMDYQPSSLLELSARIVKTHVVHYGNQDLPRSLIEFLGTYSCCLNPSCKGVYFESRVEHVKFVDFCGKYKVPLMQYLCSSSCTVSNPTSPSNPIIQENKLRRILLG